MSEKPRCKATTKKGKSCRAPVLSAETKIDGHAVSGEHCRAHDPVLPAELRLGSPAQAAVAGAKGGAAGKHPRFTEMLREAVAAEVEDFFAPYREALQATQAVVVGNGPSATVELVPDFRTRLMAMDKLLDRLEGKPRQAMELTGDGGGPIETRELVPGDADFQTEVARVLEEAEAIKGA